MDGRKGGMGGAGRGWNGGRVELGGGVGWMGLRGGGGEGEGVEGGGGGGGVEERGSRGAWQWVGGGRQDPRVMVVTHSNNDMQWMTGVAAVWHI